MWTWNKVLEMLEELIAGNSRNKFSFQEWVSIFWSDSVSIGIPEIRAKATIPIRSKSHKSEMKHWILLIKYTVQRQQVQPCYWAYQMAVSVSLWNTCMKLPTKIFSESQELLHKGGGGGGWRRREVLKLKSEFV